MTSSYQSSAHKPITVPKAGADGGQIADSYTSDDFEETSMSMSGSNPLSNNAPTVKTEPVAKQPLKTLSQAQKTGPATKPLKNIEESSEAYENEDFESLSRSQQQMNQVLPVAN